MTIWEDLIQGSEKWHAARAGRVTASQFKRVLTAAGGKDSSSWKDYALTLTAEIISPEIVPAFAGNRHTDRGNELEPRAREYFCQLTGLVVEQVGFITREDGIVGCSPDGLIVHEDSYVAGLEIKAPAPKTHLEYLLNGTLPDEYKQQVHGSMAVTGLDTWHFFSYCEEVSGKPLRPLHLEVKRDHYTERLSDALDRFLIYYG
ncbi:YqaJ viral recombinase family protein, partial [Luteolibacter pohnpeiensis]